ncbi:MAG: PaaX family transcriptional regulator C-terminal domain-containing protein [Rhodoglobus sp.]
MIPDDIDSRPGSATSLLRTFVGAELRELGGWISSAHLVRIMASLSVSAPGARSAIARVKSKGLLLAETVDGVAGYRINALALPMLEGGDRRIYRFRQQGDDDLWCLISFSVPESRRDVRHQLRRRLGWIGCGTVAMGLWICPQSLTGEVITILDDLALRDCATLFVAGAPVAGRSLAELAPLWWDLPRLRGLHEAFIAAHSQQNPAPTTDADLFARYIFALDQWRMIPYLDPGLPDSALPPAWPGRASAQLFASISGSQAVPALRFAHTMGAQMSNSAKYLE